MRKSTSQAIALVVALAIIAGFVIWSRKASDVPVFSVHFPPDPYEDRLVVCQEGKANLLFSRRREYAPGGIPQPVYRYRSESLQFEQANVEDLRRANEQGLCARVSEPMPTAGRVRVDTGRLRFTPTAGKPLIIKTKGETALDARVSPTADLVAVLTTDGWKRPTWRGWWISFGGGYGGQHFVEVFDSSKDMNPTTVVRIPFTTARGIDTMAWSADGGYVVVLGSCGRLAIISATPELNRK